MKVSEAIQTKRAVRAFQQVPLPEDVMLAILNAGRRAQSAKNTQPWKFLAITNRALLEQLSQMGTYAGHLAGAALGVCILTPDPDSRWSVMFDAGQAAAYMQLAAWELGVGSVPATIYEPEKARVLLRFPAELHLRAALSFGYPADETVLTRPNRAGGRAALQEIVHWNGW
jgi:nitroreductase